jgi:hypothetical protein
MNDKTRNLLGERHDSLSRRHFFRGLGACIALPGFASFARAAASGKGAPARMAFVYVPNGMIPSAWWPETVASCR